MRRTHQLSGAALRLLCVCGAILAAPTAFAEGRLSGAEFDARTSGKTITFVNPAGQFYGAEQYLGDRRVQWMVADGICTRGSWSAGGSEAAPLICFSYDERIEPLCWVVEARDDQLFAYVDGTPPENAIRSSQISNEPLPCPAQDLGM